MARLGGGEAPDEPLKPEKQIGSLAAREDAHPTIFETHPRSLRLTACFKTPPFVSFGAWDVNGYMPNDWSPV